MFTLSHLLFCLSLCFANVFAAFAITGVKVGGVQSRLEIRTMANQQPMMFNLYILALQKFQQEPQDNTLSYYQILGIHGVPNVAWDGVQGSAGGIGYCVHASTLFPTWHRPYVALFEQNLVRAARKIAQQFTGSQRTAYMDIAKRLRQPYWDWAIKPASGQSALPAEMSAIRITVDTPKNGRQTIDNPLYSYTYHPLESRWYASPWNQWANTKRYPVSFAANAYSQPAVAGQTLSNNRPNTQSTLFQWFTTCKKWLEMSNDNPKQRSPGCFTSLEQIHNGIHNQIGGSTAVSGSQRNLQGHMTAIPYSAHDPSFMLHHA